MGQRHQLFVIARVKGGYRCVAAFHSQWCYGVLTVEAAARLIRAFINPFNAAAIASELTTLGELDVDELSPIRTDEIDDPDVLCPYLAGVFMTSFRVDPVEGRINRLCTLSVGEFPSWAHNDDGYTYFDITEPGKPRYCFSWDAGPLNYRQYLRIYYKDRPNMDPSISRILGRTPLVDVSTLAEVWPDNKFFSGGAHESMGARDAVAPPRSPSAGPAVTSALPAVTSAIRDLLTTDRDLAPRIIASRLESVITVPGFVDVLRTELLAANVLNGNGVCLLKHLLSTDQAKSVDLKPWLSTGALDAASLFGLSSALRSAEYLDLSCSHTLTTDVIQRLVSQLPNLRHVVAFGCAHLGQLTRALPLTTYLTSLSLLNAVHQTVVDEVSAQQCIFWAEESDAPAGISILLFCLPFDRWPNEPDEVQWKKRYGVELGQFGAEGVIRGFTQFVEHLFRLRRFPNEHEFFFEMRAFFHSISAVPVSDCLAGSLNPSECYAYGTLPSSIRDVFDRGRTYGETYFFQSTEADDYVTRVPRHPGWVLVLDMKDIIPFSEIDHESTSRADYAFERWDLVPGQAQGPKALRPVERLSAREWVGRLPAGHGPVPDAVLTQCEAVLTRLNVALRANDS